MLFCRMFLSVRCRKHGKFLRHGKLPCQNLINLTRKILSLKISCHTLATIFLNDTIRVISGTKTIPTIPHILNKRKCKIQIWVTVDLHSPLTTSPKLNAVAITESICKNPKLFLSDQEGGAKWRLRKFVDPHARWMMQPLQRSTLLELKLPS